MILTSRQGDVALRSSMWPGFMVGGNASVPPPGWNAEVDSDTAMGVPAAFRAVNLAAEAVAAMCTGVFRGDGLERVEVASTWQARFFDGQPNDDESWFSVWQQTEASLTAQNNAYWWLTYDSSMRVAAVQVLDPALVTVRRGASGREFEVSVRGGRKTVGSDTVLQFRGTGAPGAVVAPNPLDLFVEALGSAAGRIKYENGFYARGMGSALAVSFPADVSADQVREYVALMQNANGGVANQHKIRVLGGGATASNIGISLRDAQFIEGMQFTVSEVARIYNVDESLLGGGPIGRSGGNPLTPEHELTRWLRWGLEPRLRRIEAAVNHHPAFFGSGARDRFEFEDVDLVRGDVATEDAIAQARVQSGRITVNEWRASKELPPLPGGDVPQFTPVGGAPNPDTLAAPAAPAKPAAEIDQSANKALDAAEKRISDLEADRRVAPAAPVVNLTMPPMDIRIQGEKVEPRPIIVQPPDVRVNVEPTPVTVNVAATEVVVPEAKPDLELRRLAKAIEAANARVADALDAAGESDPALARIAAGVERIAAAEEAEAAEPPAERTVTFTRDQYGNIAGAEVVET